MNDEIETYDPYKALAEAIIDQAIDDYIDNHQKIKKFNQKKEELVEKLKTETDRRATLKIYEKIDSLNLSIEKCLDEIDDVEKFIRSSWFNTLTDKDPDRLLDKLKEAVKKK